MERFLLLLLILLSRTVMVAFLFPLVNCGKGITAKWQGDDSAFRQGRITLDPRVHFDLAGCLATMLIGYGWSKPVPMSPVRMNNYKRGVILVSLSGPVTYMLLAVIFRYIAELIAGCAGVDTIGVKLNVIGFIIMLFLRLSMISVCIGVFHLTFERKRASRVSSGSAQTRGIRPKRDTNRLSCSMLSAVLLAPSNARLYFR